MNSAVSVLGSLVWMFVLGRRYLSICEDYCSGTHIISMCMTPLLFAFGTIGHLNVKLKKNKPIQNGVLLASATQPKSFRIQLINVQTISFHFLFFILWQPVQLYHQSLSLLCEGAQANSFCERSKPWIVKLRRTATARARREPTNT